MNGALNDVLGAIGKYGGDRSRLNDIQAQSLRSLIDGVSFKVAKKATRRSTVDDLTGEILRVMNINGVKDPLALKTTVSKVVEWELGSLKEGIKALSESNSFPLRERMSVSDLLDMLPVRKEVEILETTYEVIYTVNGILNYNEVKCDYFSIEGGFVLAFKDSERVAVYNKNNFVCATLL